MIRGEIHTRKWTDNAGQERYSTEIVLNKYRGELTMLDTASGGRDRRDAYDGDTGEVWDDKPEYHRNGGGRTPANDLDDDIPFLSSNYEHEPYLKRKIIL